MAVETTLHKVKYVYTN